MMKMKNPVCYHFHININNHHNLNVSNFQQRNFPLFSSWTISYSDFQNSESNLFNIQVITEILPIFQQRNFPLFGSSIISYSDLQSSEPNLFDILVIT